MKCFRGARTKHMLLEEMLQQKHKTNGNDIYDMHVY